MEREGDHPGDRRDAELAVRLGIVEPADLSPARADHELADPTFAVLTPIGVLRCEPFVVVVVAVHDDVGTGRVQRAPERVDRRVVAVLVTRAEPGLMPDCERAGRRVRRQVGRQPAALFGIGVAAANLRAIAVEDDDVPLAEVVRVPRVAVLVDRVRAEVVAIALGVRGVPVVVARRRSGPVLEPTPARPIALREVVDRAVVVGVVASGEDRARDAFDELRCRLVTVASAGGDVAGADEDGIARWRWRRRWRGRRGRARRGRTGPRWACRKRRGR